jgi:hypothetical protein
MGLPAEGHWNGCYTSSWKNSSYASERKLMVAVEGVMDLG